MNPDESPIEAARRKGGELATSAQDSAAGAIREVEARVRSNPWLFLGIALLAGAVLAALIPRRKPEPVTKLEAVRDWLRGTYDDLSTRLPDRDDVRSAMKSAVDTIDIPGRIGCLRKKLHLD